MGERKQKLYTEALRRHGVEITWPDKCRTFAECFTEFNGRLIFWYNYGKDTHTVMEPKIENNLHR